MGRSRDALPSPFFAVSDYFKPMRRTPPPDAKRDPIVAYDFETTRIPKRETDPMTVKPLFITFHGRKLVHEARLERRYDLLAAVFREVWPALEHNTLLCAFNANRFDLRIFMYGLLGTEFTVEPFASKVSGLRGAIVRLGRKRVKLVDPIAMLGLQCDLKTFVSVFAPNFPKGELNLERVTFNPNNRRHVLYARRDSECLYHAMEQAQTVVRSLTGHNLSPTIGALAIRSFMSRMPSGTAVPALRPEVFAIIRKVVMRGGFVFSRRYRGALWTYDLNQAYAFAMRECCLPSGRALPARTEDLTRPGVWRVKLKRSTPSAVPYTVRACNPPYRVIETYGEGCVTWLTSDEVSCLRKHSWSVETLEGYVFEGSFNMESYVTSLERKRKRFDKTHPVNVLCKGLGNNAYGKTLQEPVTARIVLSKRKPRGGFPMVEADAEGSPIFGFWVVPETKDNRRVYERPQLGAFITAYVRCVLFDAIMGDPSHFVKADTDSVSFTREQALPISSWRYGAWKVESAGDYHIVVAKKVYWSSEKVAAKGMRLRQLSRAAFERWYKGQVPKQTQIQLQSWKKRLAPTWKAQERRGTAVDASAPPIVRSPRVRPSQGHPPNQRGGRPRAKDVHPRLDSPNGKRKSQKVVSRKHRTRH